VARHREEHADIVPVHSAGHAAGAVGGHPPFFRAAAEFGARHGQIIERVRDTILYLHISNLSVSENKTYRYLRIENEPRKRESDLPTVSGDRVWLPCSVAKFIQGELYLWFPVRHGDV
jgi:hypothetical protein